LAIEKQAAWDVDRRPMGAQSATIRMHPEDDHSYYFISTFMAEHVAWHTISARNLLETVR
ncbi:MAG: hypothetical protein M3N34_10205, partial [Pseudomonadota bacterium]|nr:hypothetical protein [Pseudomonadota bacterium]